MNREPTLADLVSAVLALAGRVEKLETAVMKLGARMRQPNNETFAPSDWCPEVQKMLVKRMPRNIAGAFAAIGSIDNRVSDLHLHLNAIRAHLNAINDDADQRLTFRNWIADQ